MNTKMLGGILLIVGTSIGGGMLALPIACAKSGFISSSIFLILCWAVMTLGAFLILEVNLWFPAGNNMISMARQTLGKWGEVLTWLTYTLLLYSLLAAYISGGSAIFHDVLVGLHWKNPPEYASSILFVIVFGYIVYRGIQPVDYVNRLLMALKLGSLILLIAIALPYLKTTQLVSGKLKEVIPAITIMMTSFGFATIVPSLRSYFNSDAKKIRFAIWVGSLIPLICYLFWNFAILGTLPREGGNGLISILNKGGDVTELTQSLSLYLNNTSITFFSHIFTIICVLTAFLGVSLGLFDFIADGFSLKKLGKNNLLISVVTFLPPLIIVLLFPSIFVKALSYAGIFGVTLLVLLPALMAFYGRYFKKERQDDSYRVPGGIVTLFALVLFSFAVILIGLIKT